MGNVTLSAFLICSLSVIDEDPPVDYTGQGKSRFTVLRETQSLFLYFTY